MGLFNKKELLKIEKLEKDIANLQNELNEECKKNEELGIYSYEEALEKVQQLEARALNLKNHVDSLTTSNTEAQVLSDELTEKNEKLQRSLDTQKKKLKQAKELLKAMLQSYKNDDFGFKLEQVDRFMPTVSVRLQCLTYQDLKKEFRENEKNINTLLEKYESRYTTKANKTIYQLMVIALQAELQNILANMKYDKLEKAIEQVTVLCAKYDIIVSEGNQQIAPTIKRFIGELQYLFTNAVKIEYEYYVKKEQERAEQAAIREQMRQEAEERKELEKQRQQIEKEESKFTSEIENVKELLVSTTDETKIQALEEKIRELQNKLLNVEERKEDIINRQNGKAGNVYVISNLGSFGPDVFKVGMTRRLEPMDRVRELGDASVPFAFDVHAMIFSEDAVSLEYKLHQVLDQYRLNKINLRKEFFKLPLDMIEQIVLTEDPAASFNRTMLAEQYRQSLSLEEQIHASN